MRSDRGLTLIELVVVLIIILTLAGILVPVIMKARAQGLKTKCKSNLQQIGKACMMYRDDYLTHGKELNPKWLRDMLPTSNPGANVYRPGYLGKREILVCPVDSSYGNEGGKPDNAADQYAELDEGSSYMYEFNMGANCTWDYVSRLTLPGSPTVDSFIDLDGNKGSPSKWGEVKVAQMRYGDVTINTSPDETRWHGYSVTRFPLLRCFWHTADEPDTDKPRVMNLAYQGNFFLSGSDWEMHSVH